MTIEFIYDAGANNQFCLSRKITASVIPDCLLPAWAWVADPFIRSIEALTLLRTRKVLCAGRLCKYRIDQAQQAVPIGLSGLGTSA
ncbi:MAG: hypothetical protein ACO33A_14685 [Hyphomonas sp.]